MIIITILQIIGIVFACIGGFLVFAFVTPFMYGADAAYHGKPSADVRASWLLGLLRFFVTYTDERPKVLVKLLFFTIFDSTKPKKKKKKRKKNKSSRKQASKKPVAVNEEETELFDIEDEDASESERSFKDKFIAIMDKIMGFLKTAREKAEVFAEWLDADHRRMYAFLWENGLKILKKIKPKHFEAYIRGGTGDPSVTGMIVSYTSIALGLAGISTVRIDPDFENKGIDADVAASGHFFVFPVLLIALKIYRNRDFRRFILKK